MVRKVSTCSNRTAGCVNWRASRLEIGRLKGLGVRVPHQPTAVRRITVFRLIWGQEAGGSSPSVLIHVDGSLMVKQLIVGQRDVGSSPIYPPMPS